LFDLEHPQFPQPAYMAHFIHLFFEKLGPEFPFLNYEEISTDFSAKVLSPLVANCVAAMAARYSTLSELCVCGLDNVSTRYGNNAKARHQLTILAASAHVPSMDTLRGLMLLSWFEYKHSRNPDLRMFCQMTVRMAVDLGLSDEDVSIIIVNGEDKLLNHRQSTWASILQLLMTASSCRLLLFSSTLKTK
ncbi:hypothetical protein B0H10DRAFT_1843485, partial [Mycena sp. CBHHK59/15]